MLTPGWKRCDPSVRQLRIFLDTNILISAALFENGVIAEAYTKAVSFPNMGMISRYVADEALRVVPDKFPDDVWRMERFFKKASALLIMVATPEELQITHAIGRPILRAAVAARADLLLTGDKHLLNVSIDKPIIMKGADFLSRYC